MPPTFSAAEPPPETTFLTRLEASLRPADDWGRLRRGARPAAVNTILFLRAGAWHIPFVVRSPSLRSHPGQVGLPGGGLEPGETALAAALRETEEEVALPATALRVLGASEPLYTAVSNFSVATFVSHLELAPERFSWTPGELTGVVEIPLALLLDERAWHQRGPLPGPQLETQEVVVWGLTAAILHQGILPRLRVAVG